jgi:CheY-like chemotaxis protein
MRVLIADDYDDAREAIGRLLELRGINVIEARNGREAVERAFAGNLDLILLDLEMPVMDGFAAFECLRHIVHLADVPIIAISAHTDDTWVKRAMAYGFTAYLSKPLQFETLAGTLSRYLPNSRP